MVIWPNTEKATYFVRSILDSCLCNLELFVYKLSSAHNAQGCLKRSRSVFYLFIFSSASKFDHCAHTYTIKQYQGGTQTRVWFNWTKQGRCEITCSLSYTHICPCSLIIYQESVLPVEQLSCVLWDNRLWLTLKKHTLLHWASIKTVMYCFLITKRQQYVRVWLRGMHISQILF